MGEAKMIQHNNGFRSGTHSSPTASVGRVIRRVIELAELQAELLKVDARDGLKALVVPVLMLAIALAMAMGSIPVLLLALAEMLQGLGLSEGLSLLLAAVVGMAVAAGTAWFGWKAIRKAATAFERSKVELRNNVTWFRDALKHPSSDNRVDTSHQA
ncbi:MAG: phage holin family protein [Thermoguttaceae bacterium]